MTRRGPARAELPPGGLWRVGRSPNPLQSRPPEAGTLGSSRAGNRFDVTVSPDVGILYFSTDLETCYSEVLARFRPDPRIASIVRKDWADRGWMEIGAVPADWRFRRSVAQVYLEDDQPILDLTATATVDFLREELAYGLATLGYDDLDHGLLRGPDRRVTRLVADWAYQQYDGEVPRWWGIKYTSRLDNSGECWAVFPDAEMRMVLSRPVALDDPALEAVARRFQLKVF